MPDFLYGETAHDKLEFEWNHELSRVKKNHNGTTGWGHIHRRSGGVKHNPPDLSRVHICRNNPCSAVWPESKYGVYGAPIHVQQLEWTADLEADLSGDAHGAGGEPSAPSAPPPLPPPDDAPPTPAAEACLQSGDVLEPSLGSEGHCAESQGAEGQCIDARHEQEKSYDQEEEEKEKEKEDEEVPVAVAAVPEALPHCEPTSAPLQVLRPGEATGAVRVIPRPSFAVSPAHAAPSLPASHQTELLNKVLQLARSIRTARSYVGYMTFVCFALCKHLLVHMWEGAVRVNVIKAYAPWALEYITAEPVCDGICCCIAPAVAGGGGAWYPVSDEHSLHEVKHYVAGVPMGQALTHDTTTLVGFYNDIGIALLGTVCDGDWYRHYVYYGGLAADIGATTSAPRGYLRIHHPTRGGASLSRPLVGMRRALNGRTREIPSEHCIGT